MLPAWGARPEAAAHREPHSAWVMGMALLPESALVGKGPAAGLDSRVLPMSRGSGLPGSWGWPAGAGVPYRKVCEWPPAGRGAWRTHRQLNARASAAAVVA